MEKETHHIMDTIILITEVKTHVQEIAEQERIVLIFPVKDMVPESESRIRFQEMQQLDTTMIIWLKNKRVKGLDHVLLLTAELLQDKFSIFFKDFNNLFYLWWNYDLY